MAFCKYCGTQLAEGQTCACPQAQAAAQAAQQPPQQPQWTGQQPPQQPPQQPTQQQWEAQQQAAAQAAARQQQWAAAQAKAVNAAKSVRPYLGEYFSSPSQAIRNVIQRDHLSLAVSLTIIRALALFLALYRLTQGLVDWMVALSGGLTSGIKISVPILSFLLYGSLMALACMALFILLVFLMVKLQHGTASLRAVYEASAANGILTSMLLLAACLISFVSLRYCLLVLCMSCIVWLISGVLTAQILCPQDSFLKFWLVYIAGAVIVLVIGSYVVYPLLIKAIGDISVTSTAWGEATTEYFRDNMGDLPTSLSDLLSALGREMSGLLS